MSAHDSVSMVYKCMLRGAADFLVKPIRINELKNLWQHVWRRQYVCLFLTYYTFPFWDANLAFQFSLTVYILILVSLDEYGTWPTGREYYTTKIRGHC